MSIVFLTEQMVETHATHKVKSPTCPLCDRFGATPNDERVYVKRLFAVNPPYSTEPSSW